MSDTVARIPLSRPLLNHFLAKALAGRGTPIRELDIRPLDGDRFDAVITVTWPFVPVLTASFVIEQQPVFPSAPVLVLRWSFLGPVGAIASRLVASFNRLPPGVRLDGDRVFVDLAALTAGSAASALLPHLKTLELHTIADRAIVEVELAVPA